MNLDHDGILGAAIYHWDGRRSSLGVYDFPQDPRAIPFDLLGSTPKHEAVIGAAGGHEVLVSLYYGVQHVDAVELNPVTVDLVTTRFANFDGHLAQNPAVSYITNDGRSFMARSHGHFGLIWYPAPDSYAATNGALSSAYVLSESYLYTTNGLVSNLQHLTKTGIFVAQFGEVDDTYDL
jgi:spermidine synthase